MEEINYFGQLNYRGRNDRFGIKTDDRRRHMYVIGKTGMGKTAMLQNMAIQDIINGNGVGIVDPHGEFAEAVLQFVPKERIKDKGIDKRVIVSFRDPFPERFLKGIFEYLSMDQGFYF